MVPLTCQSPSNIKMSDTGARALDTTIIKTSSIPGVPRPPYSDVCWRDHHPKPTKYKESDISPPLGHIVALLADTTCLRRRFLTCLNAILSSSCILRYCAPTFLSEPQDHQQSWSWFPPIVLATYKYAPFRALSSYMHQCPKAHRMSVKIKTFRN